MTDQERKRAEEACPFPVDHAEYVYSRVNWLNGYTICATHHAAEVKRLREALEESQIWLGAYLLSSAGHPDQEIVADLQSTFDKNKAALAGGREGEGQ